MRIFIVDLFQFVGSIMGASLPVPAGSFVPNFRAGAALGRIAGELMHSWFPHGESKKLPSKLSQCLFSMLFLNITEDIDLFYSQTLGYSVSC